MYANCLFCYADLGRNDRLSRFPVGRRLAFDAARGRLWVVCRRCRRWNLSPLEERWETVEECERIFRRTRVRVSTDQIGLVELPGGTSLIRIGKPLRPEFAAWRYGRRFIWRRVRAGAVAGLGTAGAAGAAIGSVSLGFGALALAGAYATAVWILDDGPKRRVSTRVRVGNELLRVRQEDAETSRVFVDGDDDEHGLALHHTGGVMLLRGPEARRALGHVVTALNPFGGAPTDVAGAVEVLDHVGSAEECIRFTLRRADRAGGWLHDFPIETRLALEMALQEEAERRALEGELAELERAWRDAEEIAAIADDLLLPRGVAERLEGMRAE